MIRHQADRPITQRAEDLLGRAGFADAIVRQLDRIPADEGFVVALTGPWGAGKSSVLNLVRETLANHAVYQVVSFNPWLFKGSTDLISAFFRELARAVQLTPTDDGAIIAERLQTYADVLNLLRVIPVAGAVASTGAGALNIFAKYKRAANRPPTLEQTRSNLISALRQSHRTYVVVLDDLDRLEALELIEILRLVRMVGDLPRIIYIASYDEDRVVDVLTQHGEGRPYLEKIVQLAVDLPPIGGTALEGLLRSELTDVCRGLGHPLPESADDFENIFFRVLAPLCTTIRDIRRVINALPIAIELLAPEVALVDILALTAVRILLPGVHAQLSSLADVLTNLRAPGGNVAATDPVAKVRQEAVNALIHMSGNPRVTEEFLRLCFPATRRYIDNHHFSEESLSEWRRERRIAHPHVLRFYLSRALLDISIPTERVRQITGAFGDPNQLQRFLDELPGPEWHPLLERLLDYRELSAPDDIAKALPVLLAFRSSLPEIPPPGIVNLSTRNLFDIVLARFLANFDLAALLQVYNSAASLSDKWALVTAVSGQRPPDSPLTETDVAALQRRFTDQVLRSSVDDLAREPQIFKLVQAIHESDTDQGRKLLNDILRHDGAFIAALVGARHSVRRQSMDSVLVHQSDALHWEVLASAFGEAQLRERVLELSARNTIDNLNANLANVLVLARAYAEGKPGLEAP